MSEPSNLVFLILYLFYFFKKITDLCRVLIRVIEMLAQQRAQSRCLVTGSCHHVNNLKKQIIPNLVLGVHYLIQVKFYFPNYVLSSLIPLNAWCVGHQSLEVIFEFMVWSKSIINALRRLAVKKAISLKVLQTFNRGTLLPSNTH